ncbi:MAG: site-specific integrase [Candidatus Krumholzibacteriia bacterium]
MLEHYFVRPTTVDRIRATWLAESMERYVAWLADQGYSPHCVRSRVPLLVQFSEFTRQRGATAVQDTTRYIDEFVDAWVTEHGGASPRAGFAKEIRGPIEQMLRLVVPGFRGRGRPRSVRQPFREQAPGFFAYLRDERGLREASIHHYDYHLKRFEIYLARIDLHDLSGLSPPILSAFMTQRSGRLSQSSLTGSCVCLRVFLRYLAREGHTPSDLSSVIESPRAYRLAALPRSISWEEVRRVLEIVDRRTPGGRRDYAILLLLVTYGLRAREVAALTLDDIDWRQERLRIPERKAGHSTAYPLSPIVGEAVLGYIRDGRPDSAERFVFFRVLAPFRPLGHAAISSRAAHYLRRAGVAVPRPGSHTLRHTCVQRLVDADFSLKVIGDYVGHRAAASTEVYSKVAVETLRQIALGDGEDVL